MSKYIIKNCPAITDGKNIENICISSNACCEMITDCLLKQIVETCCDYVETSSYELAEEIIELLAIQEVE